jgi:hypothetical protein
VLLFELVAKRGFTEARFGEYRDAANVGGLVRLPRFLQPLTASRKGRVRNKGFPNNVH